MNLSYAAAVVLHAVSSGLRYGFDIMDASGLPGGTVYPALRRLESAGFVRSNWESNANEKKAKRPRRRYYEVSGTGSEALSTALKRFPLLRQPLPANADSVEIEEA